jgi:hypothetical protein
VSGFAAGLCQWQRPKVKPVGGGLSRSGTKQNRPAAADRLVSPTEESGLRRLARYCRSLLVNLTLATVS